MGRIDEMWMTCRASLTAAVLNVRRMGMRCGRAPQIAILSMRLSLTHITIPDAFALALPLALALLLRHCRQTTPAAFIDGLASPPVLFRQFLQLL